MYNSLQPGPTATGVPLVIITGLSGAGKSQAMRFMEDLGCFCVDNLPPSLIPTFFHLCVKGGVQGAGVVIASDVRSGALFGDFAETIDTLKSLSIAFELVFLDCSAETLIHRFKEVRRNHPLQASGQSMEQAIEEERRRLVPIRELATQIIDTSDLRSEDLRRTLVRNLVGKDTSKTVVIEVISFGFKYGIPRSVDFAFDVRFLKNPFYDPNLRALTGEDRAVYEYVMKVPLAETFFNKVTDLIELTLDSFVEKGKTRISIGIGCTGGRHRSVAFAERMSRHFGDRGTVCHLTHRDVGKPQQ
jgi:RNase adapter protein RapZ